MSTETFDPRELDLAYSSGNTQYVIAAENSMNGIPIPDFTGGNQGGGGGGNGGGTTKTLVDIIERRGLGGVVERVKIFSDGSEQVSDSRVDTSAGEAAAEMFRAAGLGDEFVNSLMGSINAVYASNTDPNQAQILSAIYNSDAYKTRFAANEDIRKRIASGQARPGDRLLTPKEYIDAESTYRQILQNANMPTGFYDQQSDFNSLIANGVSATEFKNRVDTAYSALNEADSAIIDSLNKYYNLSQNDLVAYLLDPAKATPLLEGKATTNAFGLNSETNLTKQYESAQVGGAFARQGMDLQKGISEEIVASGQKDKAAEAAGLAGAAAPDLKRLGTLYGESLDYTDLVRESLNLTGGAESGRKRRKLASKERAAFGGQSALGKTSLTRALDV